MLSCTRLRPGLRASLAALFLIPLVAGPASAGKIRVTPTIDKKGMREDLPAPQQSDVKVRDPKTGKVVAHGTVAGSPDSSDGFKTGEIVVPPGKYDVEIHMREGTKHYGDVQHVHVRPGKSTAGVTPHLHQMSNQEIDEYEAQNAIDRLDRKIARAADDVAEYTKLRDRSKKLGNDELADKFQKQIDKAEAKKAGLEGKRAARQAKLDEMRGKKDPRKIAEDNVRKAGQAAKPRVDPAMNMPNVPSGSPNKGGRY
jgi:hypothetical protein